MRKCNKDWGNLHLHPCWMCSGVRTWESRWFTCFPYSVNLYTKGMNVSKIVLLLSESHYFITSQPPSNCVRNRIICFSSCLLRILFSSSCAQIFFQDGIDQRRNGWLLKQLCQYSSVQSLLQPKMLSIREVTISIWHRVAWKPTFTPFVIHLVATSGARDQTMLESF